MVCTYVPKYHSVSYKKLTIISTGMLMQVFFFLGCPMEKWKESESVTMQTLYNSYVTRFRKIHHNAGWGEGPPPPFPNSVNVWLHCVLYDPHFLTQTSWVLIALWCRKHFDLCSSTWRFSDGSRGDCLSEITVCNIELPIFQCSQPPYMSYMLSWLFIIIIL